MFSVLIKAIFNVCAFRANLKLRYVSIHKFCSPVNQTKYFPWKKTWK